MYFVSGPPEMDVCHALHQSLFQQQYDVSTHQSNEYLQELVSLVSYLYT
jgi:hypothetical protein